MKNHPLFPEHPDADILKIHVTRHSSGGVQWCAEPFQPDGLTELSQVLERFGGGHYELVGHGPHGGKKATSGFNARQVYRIEGAENPLNPSAIPAAPQMPAQHSNGHQNGGGDSMSAMLGLVGSMMTGMIGMMTAVMSRPAPAGGDSAAMQAMTAVMGHQTQLLAAVLSRPQGDGGTAATKDPLKFMLDVVEVVTNLKQGAVDALGAAKGTGTEIALGDVIKHADQMVDVIRKAKTLADKDVPEAEVAATLAADAAAAAENGLS